MIFRPLLYGIVIAFFLTQIYNFFEKRFNKLLSNKFPDKEKTKKLSKIITHIFRNKYCTFNNNYVFYTIYYLICINTKTYK